MLGQPGSDENVKPHYALHCVLNHALIVKDDKSRREFSALLAKNLSNDDLSTYNKAYLCQELQWLGREEAVESLARLLLDEELVEPAAMALVAIKSGAAVALRTALPDASGKCQLSIIDALVALGDSGSAKELETALQDGDQEVRVAARAGLARIPDPAAVAAVLKSIDGVSGWERTQAAKCCLVAAESLAQAGKNQEAGRVYDRVVQLFAQESEAHVREAATLGKSRVSRS